MDFTKFQNNLIFLVNSRGKSFKDVAIDTNISTAALSRYINGYRHPDIESLIKLSQYFNVSIEWLLGISDIPATHIEEQYMVATPTDREVINMILSKYKRDEQ